MGLSPLFPWAPTSGTSFEARSLCFCQHGRVGACTKGVGHLDAWVTDSVALCSWTSWAFLKLLRREMAHDVIGQNGSRD